MAKITMTIETNDVGELQDIWSQLSGHSTDHSYGIETGKYTEQEWKDSIPVTAEPAQGEQTGKRTRRTKAQIEADNAVQSATENNTMSASATGAQQGSQENSGSTQQQSSNESGSGSRAVDPFAEQIRESAKEPAASDVTNAQVRAAMTKYLSGGHTAKEASDVLQRIGGVPNLGALDPSHYAAALAAFEAG